jgi:hypothetical protein
MNFPLFGYLQNVLKIIRLLRKQKDFRGGKNACSTVARGDRFLTALLRGTDAKAATLLLKSKTSIGNSPSQS